MGGRTQRHADADEVRLAQQLHQRHTPCRKLRFILGLGAVAAVQHRHAKTKVRAPGHGRTNPAKADDAQGLAVYIHAEARGIDALSPAAVTHQLRQLACASRGHHQQHEPGIGGGFGHRIGGIGQTDAAVAQIAQGVVVEASRHAGNHLERRRVVEQLSIQR
ncbi:hypothetical protein D3C76_1343890 [compost metagenome]